MSVQDGGKEKTGEKLRDHSRIEREKANLKHTATKNSCPCSKSWASVEVGVGAGGSTVFSVYYEQKGENSHRQSLYRANWRNSIVF